MGVPDALGPGFLLDIINISVTSTQYADSEYNIHNV